jgi:hypothetical protein
VPREDGTIDANGRASGGGPIIGQTQGLTRDYGVWAGTSGVQRRKLRRVAPRVPLPAIVREWWGRDVHTAHGDVAVLLEAMHEDGQRATPPHRSAA